MTPQERYPIAIRARDAAQLLVDDGYAELKPGTPIITLTQNNPGEIILATNTPMEANVLMDTEYTAGNLNGPQASRHSSSDPQNFTLSGGWSNATFKARLVRIVQDDTNGAPHEVFGDWSETQSVTEP